MKEKSRGAFLATWARLLGLLVTVLAQQPKEIDSIDRTLENGCIVEFVIDTSSSSVALTASVVQPLPVAFEVKNEPYINQGVQGSFYARIGAGKCSEIVPTGADLLEELGNGAVLLSGRPGVDRGAPGLVEFYPYNITFTATSVGTVVNLWDLGLNMSLSLSGLPVGPVASVEDTNDEQLSGELVSESASGDVFTTNFFSPMGESFPFGEHMSENNVLVSASVNGSSVVLNVTDFNVTMAVPYASDLNPGLDSLAYYRLLGNVILRGVAGCDVLSCGSNGRCGVGPGETAACQCSCGWSGASCNISSGYCSDYDVLSPAQLGQLSCPVVEALPSASGLALPGSSPVPQPCSSNRRELRCNALFEDPNAAGECTCKDGFSGPRCEACETNAACASIYGANPSTCGTSVVYSSDTVFKSYTCGLDGTGLESTIVPETFYVTCNTTSPGASTDGSYCSVNFAMQQYWDNPITCRASLCSFTANASQVSCSTTSCTCERDCPDLDGIFASIQGRPAVIDCDESNECTFDIENFFVKLIAPCKTTECRVEGYSFEDGLFRVQRNAWLDPVIASIPLIALVAISVALLGILIRRRDLYFSRGAFPANSVARSPSVQLRGPVAPDSALSSVPSGFPVLSFDDLTVTLSNHIPRVVLDGVSGQAHAGQVTGIMGPSGSGKTTMISYLSQRLSPSQIKGPGSVRLGSRRLGDADTKIIGYCPQDSHLLSTLTVYETIMYSAILRLPRGTHVEEIHRVTQESIFKVRLDGVESSYVGGTGRIRGISGGERRRVSVAMELVTNPKLVLLDEPTSGLDSSSAKQVISALKSLSTSGCIVILSLHQPSPAIFSMLDRVYLLAQGRCLYDGEPGGAESYLSVRGLLLPPGDGIAEFMLECASDDQIVDRLTARREGKVVDVTGRDVEDAKDVEGVTDDGSTDAPPDAIVPLTSERRDASILTELATLTWRNGLDMVRNPTLILLHWLLALGMGIFAGCVFFQVGLDTSGAQNRAGGLIFALAFFAFTSLTTVDLVFQEKTVVGREVDGGYYRRWTYVISKLVLDGMFLRFLPILIFSAPFYPMMGLSNEPSTVALFLMTLGTFAVAVGALSLAVTLASRTAGQASFIMNIILLVCLLNSGFFVNAENMPDWISWLRYMSVLFYGYSVLITNEVSDLLFQFVVEGYTAVENVRGSTFLNILGINPTQTTNYIIILDCMYAIFCLASLAIGVVAERRGLR